MSHTPGPWRLDGPHSDEWQDPKYHVLGPSDDLDRIAIVDIDNDHGMANAHLIAAAPDLLEALRLVVRAYEPMKAPDAVRAAIAKAEGRAP